MISSFYVFLKLIHNNININLQQSQHNKTNIAFLHFIVWEIVAWRDIYKII